MGRRGSACAVWWYTLSAGRAFCVSFLGPGVGLSAEHPLNCQCSTVLVLHCGREHQGASTSMRPWFVEHMCVFVMREAGKLQNLRCQHPSSHCLIPTLQLVSVGLLCRGGDAPFEWNVSYSGASAHTCM